MWELPPAPQPPPAPPPRRGSGWALAGILVASAGFVVAGLGAVFGLVALLGGGLVAAASEGKAGGTRAFVELTRVGDLYVVLPLVVVAAVCTALAWRQTRGGGRSRATTIASTVTTATLAMVAALTAVVFV